MTLRGLHRLALAVALPVLIGAASVPDRDARDFAKAFDEAQLRRDLPALQAMVADDLVFVASSGQVQDKARFIAGYASPTLRIDPFTIVQPTYVQLGRDAAVVGGEVVLRGSEDGKPFASHFRFADTFVWRKDRWQVVHVQVTAMASPD